MTFISVLFHFSYICFDFWCVFQPNIWLMNKLPCGRILWCPLLVDALSMCLFSLTVNPALMLASRRGRSCVRSQGQVKPKAYKSSIGSFCTNYKDTALRNKSKNWLGRNQDNVPV